MKFGEYKKLRIVDLINKLWNRMQGTFGKVDQRVIATTLKKNVSPLQESKEFFFFPLYVYSVSQFKTPFSNTLDKERIIYPPPLPITFFVMNLFLIKE